MNTHMIIEAVGYAGSLLVLVSMLMTSVYKLRVINTLGSLIFTVYALIIRSYPTALMNFCLVLINLRFLWKMSRMDKDFDLVKTRKGDAFLRYFIDSRRDDIRACFPGIPLDFSDATDAYIVCCKGLPVGVTLGQEKDGVLKAVIGGSPRLLFNENEQRQNDLVLSYDDDYLVLYAVLELFVMTLNSSFLKY